MEQLPNKKNGGGKRGKTHKKKNRRRKKQWYRTGSLPEYQKCSHLLSIEKHQEDGEGMGGANVNKSYICISSSILYCSSTTKFSRSELVFRAQSWQ